MYPILKMTGYSITWRKVLVMVWAGLRGAVGLALALFILLDNEISDAAFRVRAFFFMGLIAAITIVVQGTTTGLLLQVLPYGCYRCYHMAVKCILIWCDNTGIGPCFCQSTDRQSAHGLCQAEMWCGTAVGIVSGTLKSCELGYLATRRC